MPLSLVSESNIFSGPGSLRHVEKLTEGYQRILLVSDKNGFIPSGASSYFEKLSEKRGHDVFIHMPYAGTALPITDIDALYRGLLAEGPEPDMIIAIGGGTVIDLAKIISIGYSNRCDSCGEVLENPSLMNNLPLIYIPTTAGTGSEATSFAVVYRDKIKLSVQSTSILPQYVILDPLLLQSLPKPVFNATVLDALAQATESMWAVGATPESQSYSKEAIRLILDNIEKEHTLERLEGLQKGAYWAGKAINISKTTLSHAISYPLTAYYSIPHGIAVFLTLPEITVYNFHTTESTRQEATTLERISESFDMLFSLYCVMSVDALSEKMRGMMRYLGVSGQLRDYGVAREDLDTLASQSQTKGRSDNNPRRLTISEIRSLLDKIW